MKPAEALIIIRAMHAKATKQHAEARAAINTNPVVFASRAAELDKQARALALALDALGTWKPE